MIMVILPATAGCEIWIFLIYFCDIIVKNKSYAVDYCIVNHLQTPVMLLVFVVTYLMDDFTLCTEDGNKTTPSRTVCNIVRHVWLQLKKFLFLLTSFVIMLLLLTSFVIMSSEFYFNQTVKQLLLTALFQIILKR